MADKLIFPIGFDLEEGVKQVEKDWGEMQKRLQKTFQSHTISIDADISEKVLNKLYTKFEGLIKSLETKAPQVKLKIPDTVDFEQEIKRLKVQLKSINLGELTDNESKDLYLYIRQLEALAKALKEVNKQEQLRQANDPSNKILREAQAQEKLTRAKANDALAEQRRAKIAVHREQQRAATARAEQAELRLANAKNKSADATNRQNKAYGTQLTYIQRLKQRLAIVGGLYQTIGFVTKIREVTAEFELQRVALGAIIKDGYEASKMFEQIKAAAVKSPFEIKDLVSYTKQLAAYKIETKDLFDTTMQLADISAGLGVGMERLVLAFGQIRATGYLRASEVRQLTESGIPIIEELAKKISDMRGEMVSAGDVMQMISERAISFGMVKEVFDDMTSAGGTFYKMQEKQAEILAGQWSNLKDTLSIMYDEIGRSSFVQELLQGFIDKTKYLASNWDNVVRVISSVGAGLGVYVVAMKNATIASKALTVAEAKRIALETTEEARMPRRIALLLGQNNAIKLTIALNKALIYSQAKALAATNLLSKGFWKLTTAMLSNPYTVAIAALVALGTAIFAFSTKSKSAEESIEELNGAVHKLADVKKVTPLVDELDALSEKANKTAQEQKRLAQVTTELADRYPAATRGVKEYGNEVEVTAEKVKKLHEAEMLAARKVTEATLKENEKLYEENAKKLAEINEKLASGTRTVRYIVNKGTWNERLEYKDIPLLESEIIKLGEEAKKLADENIKLGDAIKSAKIELGLMAKESTTAIDSFGSWKAEIKKFNIGIKNIKGEDIQLFDDDTINNFANLLDALERTAELYKKNEEAVKSYSETLKSENISEETKKDIEQRKARAEAERDTAKAVLEHFNALHLLKQPKDSRLSDLKKQIQDVTNAYKKYIELRKYMSKEDALENIATFFPSLGNFEPTYENMVARLEKMRDEVRAKLAKDPTDKTLIDMSRELEKSLANIKFDNLKTELERKLERLANDVAKTKTAKEFYDRILGITGDRELSATFTMSVYGETGDELAQRTIRQLEAAFEGIDLSDAINYKNFQVDWKKVADIYKTHQGDMLEANRKTAEGLIKNSQKVSADQILQWAKELEEVKSYADKRVELAKQTAERIKEIEQSNLPQEQKDALTEQYRKREEEQASKLQYEAFKDSSAYVEMFNNLDNVSTSMLEHLRIKIAELQDEWQNLDPTQLKELQSRLNAIDKELAERNPFDGLIQSIKDYQKLLRESGTKSDAEDAFTNAITKQKEEQLKLNQAIDARNKAQENYDKALKAGGSASTLTIIAKQQLDNANKNLATQQKATKEADEQVEKASKLLELWGKVGAAIKKNVVGTLEKVNSFTSGLASFLKDFSESIGVGPEETEYVNTLADGISGVASGISNIVKGVASGDIGSILSGIGSAVKSIVNLSYADKIYEANKEIARQEDALERLAYSWSRLEKAQEDALGSDYIYIYKRKIATLQRQEDAYLKQAEAERSKGKKADQDKIKEYEDAARDVADSIKDMQGELAEHFLGTDLTSAARDFAQSWIEAYKQFGNTTDAMEEKFSDMIQNMVVESIASKVVQEILKPFFDDVEKLSKEGGVLSIEDIATLAKEAPEYAKLVNEGLTGLFTSLEAAGIKIRDAGEGLTGISKDIATASEESILGLAAGINTQNFYISQIHANVALITQWVQSGGMATQGVNVSDLITLQNQHLSHLPNIAANTAATLLECQSILKETTRIANKLDSVITPQGTRGVYSLNTSL